MGRLALERGELFSISRICLMWIMQKAQKASLRLDQERLRAMDLSNKTTNPFPPHI